MIPLNPEDIMKMTTKELWETYTLILEQENEEGKDLEKEYEEDTQKIKNGIKIKIPIWYITKNWYEERPEHKKVKVTGYGKYEITSFMEEIDKREQIMRSIILDNIEIPGGLTNARN